MGYVKVKGVIGSSEKSAREIEFLVDTGAFYTILPYSLAKELGIEPYKEGTLTLADSRMVKAGISLAYIKLLDRDGILPVAVMNAPLPLLGATALEGLGLKVDPVTGNLEATRPFGLAAL